MVVALVGPPGAGKTTLAQRLAAENAMAYVSSGNLLRSILWEDSPAGADARRGAAEEAPSDAAEIVVAAALARTLPRRDVLLEGFPRSLRQVRVLDHEIDRIGAKFLTLVHVHVPERIALARVAHRLVCPRCGAVFAERDLSAACPACDAVLVRRRGDDQPDIVRRRRSFYDRDTRPMIEHYRAIGRLLEVDGGQHEADVFRHAQAALAGHPFDGAEWGGA